MDWSTPMHPDMVLDNPFVRVHVRSDTTKSQEELMDFAKKNLLQLELEDSFDDSLLVVSPREMELDDMDGIHALGQLVDTEDIARGMDWRLCDGGGMSTWWDHRIDYFVSHSWSEGQ